MLLALYALIVLSGLIEVAMGLSIAIAKQNHFLLQGAPALALSSLRGGGALVCYFIALAMFAVAGLHWEMLRCLRRGRDETHTLLQGYGAVLAIGGVLLFLAFQRAGAPGGQPWTYLFVDTLRGILLIGTSFLVATAPNTVRELRLPKQRSAGRPGERGWLGIGLRRSSSRPKVRPELPDGGRPERGGRDRGRGGDRRRSDRSRDDQRGDRRRGGRRESVRSGGVRPVEAPARRQAAPERPAVVQGRPSERVREAGSAEAGRRPGRRRGRRGGRGRSRRPDGVGSEGERAGIGMERLQTPGPREERDVGHEKRFAEAEPRERHAGAEPRERFEDAEARRRFEDAEARDRFEAFERDTHRGAPGAVRPPRRDTETGAEAPAAVPADVREHEPEGSDENSPAIEYGGRHQKMGRYSTGALFRPREKSRTTQGGRFDAEPRKEWGSGEADAGRKGDNDE